MEYFVQAQQLLDNSRQRLQTLKGAYEASVRDQCVKPDLLIEVKNFLENLRSALDYSAHGLVERYGIPPTKVRQIQFPYALESDDLTKFRQKVDRCLPGVSAARPDILARIELAQHFYGPGSNWLLGFMQLTNENKHQSLTPQKLGRCTEIRFSIEVSANSSITIPWPPHPSGPGHTEVSTFDSLVFSSNGISVPTYLEMKLELIQKLVDDLSKM